MARIELEMAGLERSLPNPHRPEKPAFLPPETPEELEARLNSELKNPHGQPYTPVRPAPSYLGANAPEQPVKPQAPARAKESNSSPVAAPGQTAEIPPKQTNNDYETATPQTETQDSAPTQAYTTRPESQAQKNLSLSETLKELGIHDDDQLIVLQRVIDTLPDNQAHTDENGNRRLQLNPDGTVPESLRKILSEENINLLTERVNRTREGKTEEQLDENSVVAVQAAQAAQAQAAQAGDMENASITQPNITQGTQTNPNIYSADKQQLQDFNSLAEPVKEALKPFIVKRLKDPDEKRNQPWRDLFYQDSEGRVLAYEDTRIENKQVLKELKSQLGKERFKANIQSLFGMDRSQTTYDGRRSGGSALLRAGRRRSKR